MKNSSSASCPPWPSKSDHFDRKTTLLNQNETSTLPSKQLQNWPEIIQKQWKLAVFNKMLPGAHENLKTNTPDLPQARPNLPQACPDLPQACPDLPHACSEWISKAADLLRLYFLNNDQSCQGGGLLFSGVFQHKRFGPEAARMATYPFCYCFYFWSTGGVYYLIWVY